jgi:hypothetical protein
VCLLVVVVVVVVLVEGSQESLDSQNEADMDCSVSDAVAASVKGSKKQRITLDGKKHTRIDFLKKN